MKYKLVVTDSAEADFLLIHGYLNERYGKKLATDFMATFARIINVLKNTPRMYELAPERKGVHHGKQPIAYN